MGYGSLELKRKVWNGDIHLGIVSIYIMFISMELDGINHQVSVWREGESKDLTLGHSKIKILEKNKKRRRNQQRRLRSV